MASKTTFHIKNINFSPCLQLPRISGNVKNVLKSQRQSKKIVRGSDSITIGLWWSSFRSNTHDVLCRNRKYNFAH